MGNNTKQSQGKTGKSCSWPDMVTSTGLALCSPGDDAAASVGPAAQLGPL